MGGGIRQGRRHPIRAHGPGLGGGVLARRAAGATGSDDNTARLWEAASGKAVATLAGHTSSVRAVAFSPDGRLVLTGSGDGTARLWDAGTGTAVATLSGHTGRVSAVAFSPDGRLVLTGSHDKTARLWEAASGKAVATLYGHTNWVMAVAFSPDGAAGATGVRRQDGAAVGGGQPARPLATLSRAHEARSWAWRSRPTARLVLTGV